MESGSWTTDSRRWGGKHVGGVGRGEEELCDPYEDAGRIYGAVCGQEIRLGNGGVAAGERPPLESSGQLSGKRCVGAAMFTTAQTYTINNTAAELAPRL